VETGAQRGGVEVTGATWRRQDITPRIAALVMAGVLLVSACPRAMHREMCGGTLVVQSLRLLCLVRTAYHCPAVYPTHAQVTRRRVRSLKGQDLSLFSTLPHLALGSLSARDWRPLRSSQASG
jgi:hypothetical protein